MDGVGISFNWQQAVPYIAGAIAALLAGKSAWPHLKKLLPFLGGLFKTEDGAVPVVPVGPTEDDRRAVTDMLHRLAEYNRSAVGLHSADWKESVDTIWRLHQDAGVVVDVRQDGGIKP